MNTDICHSLYKLFAERRLCASASEVIIAELASKQKVRKVSKSKSVSKQKSKADRAKMNFSLV